MTSSFTIAGRGWFLGLNFYDATTARQIYFAFKRMKGNAITHARTLEQSEDGGLVYTVNNYDGKTGRNRSQGWRLRGPIEHFEGTW